jgi:hypothetical protein
VAEDLLPELLADFTPATRKYFCRKQFDLETSLAGH